MRKTRYRYLGCILTFALLFAMLPVMPAGAIDSGELRQMFDRLDTVNNGNWHKDANNDESALAWGESYVLDSYVTMYEATGDTYYLDKFVTHGKSVLAQRDTSRGVTDYRGLSLPAWRNGKYTLNGEYAIFAVHTGMIVYPMARFAALVAENPSLNKYREDMELFLQAAKDAVAVHRDEWVDNGDTGYYKFPDDMPYKQAGMGLPFNQYLAMARAELMIYRATGEAQYLERARKMLQHFKNSLAVDQDTGGYIWRYSAFYSSSYEDTGHAKTDVDAAFQGYSAGVVFNAEDMVRFTNNAARKIIRPDGNIAGNILGEGTIQYPWLIGFWSAFGQFAPVITDTAYKVLSEMSYGGPSGLLAVAMLNKACSQPGYRGGEGQNPPPVDNPPPSGEMVKNGDFSQGQTGWSGPDVVVKTESNGNKYGSAKYGWNFYQYVPVEPGAKYVLSASTRRGSAASEARIAYFFYDAAGRQLASGDVLYKHKGTGWEQIPARTVTAPAGAARILIKLLVNGGSGTHDFDNISMKPLDNPPPSGEMVKNGDFSQGQTGWSGPDVVVKTESNGNKYGSAKYGWNFYQYVPVEPGAKYVLSASTRRGSAASEARIAYFFYDAAGRQLASGDVLYKHKGTGWEQIPARTVTAPAGAARILIKLLVNGGSGTHDFDNISMKKA
ncbi:MAG: hypothetical protein HPY89_04385 [Pelotomaculum sp.]|nr:hypothetical protein [Pelotomaculum sp.]